MEINTIEAGELIRALKFAADKHADHQKQDSKSSPYINHLIEVIETLWTIGKVRDSITLVSAILHDTLEHTDTTEEELESLFGQKVVSVVCEVSDDMSLPEGIRKQLQIDHAANLSGRAKQIKLADKICNVRDKINSPPKNWSMNQHKQYLDWTKEVVNNLHLDHSRLLDFYNMLLKLGYDIESPNHQEK